jgi:hypothetical protein
MKKLKMKINTLQNEGDMDDVVQSSANKKYETLFYTYKSENYEKHSTDIIIPSS